MCVQCEVVHTILRYLTFAPKKGGSGVAAKARVDAVALLGSGFAYWSAYLSLTEYNFSRPSEVGRVGSFVKPNADWFQQRARIVSPALRPPEFCKSSGAT